MPGSSSIFGHRRASSLVAQSVALPAPAETGEPINGPDCVHLIQLAGAPWRPGGRTPAGH